jgi:hypothetical protein
MSKETENPNPVIIPNDELLETLLNSARIEPKYLKRKQDLMLKELDTAFSWYQHIESQLSAWRGLHITILVAYIGFLFTVKPTNNAMRIPILVILFPFIIIEIYKRGHLIFLGKNIREVEDIFMNKDDDIFTKQIDAYVFRDTRLKYGNVFHSLISWIRYMALGIFDIEVVIWYTFIVFSSIAAYSYFHV